MDSRTDSLEQLTEEVFGHLCNIAISKCNDKMEKRKAGCGGKAMRKRVLIKNFVSDLMKAHNERYVDDDMTDCDESEYEDDIDADTTICTDESESEVTMDLDENDAPQSDCWLSGQPPVTSLYSDFIGDCMLPSREGAEGRAENKPSSSPPDSRLSIYEFLSSPSETAAEGGMPEAVSPLDTYTVPAHSFVDSFHYDMGMAARYDLTLTPLTPLTDVAETSPLQPVRAEPSDQVYLSLTSNSYSEMKTYTPLTDALPENLMANTLTDLDAQGDHLHSYQPLTPKKRRSDELDLFDDQKRLKL